jgi:succinyl-CoA synthetase beta subunit
VKKEYDFSKGERGKFYHPDTELYLPVYLEQDTAEILRKLSKKKGVDIGTIVNEWIRKDISIVETIMSK